jgi:hypothetical protein
MEWARTRKAAKETATKETGMTATKARAWEEAGRDYSSVPGFDTAAQRIATEYPGVIGIYDWSQGGDIPTNELSDKLWALLTERKERLPDLYDQEILTEAANSMHQGEEVPWEQEAEPIPFRRPGPMVRYSLVAALKAEYMAREVHRRWEEGQPLDIGPVGYALAHYEETKANTEKEEREARRERRGL